MRKTLFTLLGMTVLLGASVARAEGDEKPGIGDRKLRTNTHESSFSKGAKLGTAGRKMGVGIKTEDDRAKAGVREHAKAQRELRHDVMKAERVEKGHLRTAKQQQGKFDTAEKKGVLRNGTRSQIGKANMHKSNAQAARNRAKQTHEARNERVRTSGGEMKIRPTKDAIRGTLMDRKKNQAKIGELKANPNPTNREKRELSDLKAKQTPKGTLKNFQQKRELLKDQEETRKERQVHRREHGGRNGAEEATMKQRGKAIMKKGQSEE